MNFYVELAILLALILANGFLSMSEMALVAARKSRLHQYAEEGDQQARLALEVAESPSRMLSTVQIGITLIGILTGAFGGAALAASLASVLASWPALAPYSSVISVVVVVVVTTYLSLVLGELAPKRLALNSAEAIAMRVARVMLILSTLTRPLERILSASTEFVLRLLRVPTTNEQPITDEEVRILIEQGAEKGVFEPIEEEIVGQVFRLSDLNISALLTPRTDITWLDINDSYEEMRAKILASNHSRYPVAEGDLDHVIGLAMAKDLLARAIAGEDLNLHIVLQSPLFIPDTMPALEVLERMRTTRTHIALVIDEYGGLEGLVTLTDFVEAIIGAIPDMGETPNEEIFRREDGTFLVDGMLPIDRFQESFGIRELPEESEGYYQTVGGFVMTMLGRVPTPGDIFEWGGLRVEVMDMDGRRVDKVLVTPAPIPEADRTGG
jgi:putative hemolysin